jgi:hypothetical protein
MRQFASRPLSATPRHDSRSRQLGRLDQQGVIRANRDTLYSEALFDLDADFCIAA